MSKHFESKKESLSIINKAYNDKSELSSKNDKIKALENKYEILSKRTKSLEKVYRFHKGIVQSISSGLMTVDFNGIITFINSAALGLLEFQYQELVGSPIKNLFADEREADKVLDELLNKKKMFESREINLIGRTKKLIPIGFTTTLLSAQDSAYDGVIISFRDLTNLHHTRLQMERIDRLTTLGEVSAGIAHEIRNPLAGIKTSAQVLEETFSPGDHRSQLVARIVKEIDRSNELLKKFFNFAKPGKPKQEYVSLETLIEGVYLLLSSKMHKKEIVFEKNIESDIPDIYVDENQIEQVLINLFLNSLDAMEKGDSMTVTLKYVEKLEEVVLENSTKVVVMEIKDTGCGIDSDNLERIFNPFFTTKSDGVGLGLSISSRLIEENGGRILVESEKNQGTQVFIYFPVS
jgi:two-component system sensor histidine kinase AtoS